MQDNAQTRDSSLNAEIKALLILLLLKSGTPSGEIQTALRLATETTGNPGPDRSPGPSAKAVDRPLMPRQRIRNEYLAPMKRYAI